MPVTPQALEESRKKVQQAGEKFETLAGTGKEFAKRVKEELRLRAQERGITQLGEQAGQARREFAAAPADIRSEFAGAQPGAASQAIAQRRADLLQELSNIASLQEQSQATIGDIVGGAQSGLETQEQIAGAGFETAQQGFGNLMAQAQFEEQQRQFDIQTALERARINAQAAKAQGAEPGFGLSEAIQVYNAIKPTPEEQQKAADAESALQSVGIIRNNENLLGTAANPITRFFSPEAQKLNRHINNLADIITRYRTGAALNENEQIFYNNFVVNPMEAIRGHTGGTKEALGILENIFLKGVERGRDPREIIQSGLLSEFGGEWEVIQE